MVQRYRSAMLGLLLLVLTGCSSTTFVYNRLDFIIPWYVGKYVDLDRAQKQALKQMLVPFLSWHQGEELPTYLTLLDNIELALDEDISAAQLLALMGEAEQAWLRTERRSLQWLIALGEQLSQEQIDGFIAELREKQSEYEEEYLTRSEEDYYEDAYDNLEDSTQDYLGRLDWGQRAIYEEATAQLQRSDAIWLRERAAWLDRLQQLLQREPGWQQALRDSLASREQTRSDAYRQTYEHNTQVLATAVARVLNSRDQKQDKRLRGKIEDLREDFEALIAKS